MTPRRNKGNNIFIFKRYYLRQFLSSNNLKVIYNDRLIALAEYKEVYLNASTSSAVSGIFFPNLREPFSVIR